MRRWILGPMFTFVALALATPTIASAVPVPPPEEMSLPDEVSPPVCSASGGICHSNITIGDATCDYRGVIVSTSEVVIIVDGWIIVFEVGTIICDYGPCGQMIGGIFFL